MKGMQGMVGDMGIHHQMMVKRIEKMMDQIPAAPDKQLGDYNEYTY